MAASRTPQLAFPVGGPATAGETRYALSDAADPQRPWREEGAVDRGRGAGALPRYGARTSVAAFLAEAERQLDLSRVAEDRDIAVVHAYRGALRAAGAVIQDRRGQRKRQPAGTAWVKLRTLAPEYADLAAQCERHGRFVNRVDMGLERDVSAAVLAEVYRDSCTLLDSVRAELLGKVRAA